MQEVVKKDIVKLLDTVIIYPIADSPWVGPIHCVPKKGDITVVTNENDELDPTRIITGWRVCIDYRKLNEATTKDHFHLPFMDQMLERFTGNKYFCFLDGFSEYFQIPIDPMDQEKITFTCPFGTYAYRRMPFGLCNAPTTFQRCMLAIFHDMIEESVKVFMDDFSVFGDSFDKCLNNLDKMLQRCKDAHLVFNWEKCHFMVKEEIVLGHKVSSQDLKLTKQKSTPNWNLPFKLMFDASDFAVGAVLGQKDDLKELVDIVKSRVGYSGSGVGRRVKEDEEYAMTVKDFKKFFKRRGRCGNPNHLIGECPKLSKDKNQRAFVGDSWSNSGEEDDEKVKNEMCLVAHASSEVCSESSYFSDENSSIDDLALDNEYDKLCKMSLKIITKNKRLKATRNSLENSTEMSL
ncbi:reverse transcriptase domain-containing protein [Tanacetum coccineum]